MNGDDAERGQVPPPYALAVGFCDLIYRDRGTGKRFILGCFSSLQAFDFPATHPGLCIYLDLTNGHGKVSVKVQIIDTDGARDPVWVSQQDFNFKDPRMVAEIDLMVANLPFPEPGEYRVQVFANDQFVIERRLLMRKLERPQR